MGRPLKEYALYKGDELIGIGTVKYLAKITGKRSDSIHHYTSPTYKKEINKLNKREYDKTYFLVEVEDE